MGVVFLSIFVPLCMAGLYMWYTLNCIYIATVCAPLVTLAVSNDFFLFVVGKVCLSMRVGGTPNGSS